MSFPPPEARKSNLEDRYILRINAGNKIPRVLTTYEPTVIASMKESAIPAKSDSKIIAVRCSVVVVKCTWVEVYEVSKRKPLESSGIHRFGGFVFPAIELHEASSFV